MAVDEALARLRRRGEGVLRIYRWQRPTLSLGRNQAVRSRYDPHALASLGVDVVRRPTGGREVLHDRELTYMVAVPVEGPASLRALYREASLALVEALRALEVEAALAAPPGRTPSPDAGACFDAPARGEVVAGGRKIAGSAQRRLGDTLLQHGSLLLDQPSVALGALRLGGRAASGRVLPDAAPGLGVQGVGLRELLGAPAGFGTVAATVEAALAGRFGGSWERAAELDEAESALAEEAELRYVDSGWTWRR
jgi:lipoyl(octanoyl) transferase